MVVDLLNRLTSGPENKLTHVNDMTRLLNRHGFLSSIFLLGLAAFSPQSVLATEYYWSTRAVGSVTNALESRSGDTPWLACQKFFDSNENINEPGRNAHVVRIKYYSQNMYKCWMNFYWYDTRVGMWFLAREMEANNYEIRRSGTYCSAGKVTNPTTGECAKDEQKGTPAESSCAASSVKVGAATGNLFKVESDYQSISNTILNFTRSYNSVDGVWRHHYSTYLRFAGTTYLSLVMADGRESFFTVSGTTVTASPTELGKLVKLADGWQYTAKNNERFSFDAAGRLTRWINAAGLEQQLSYSGSTITVTDTLGHSLSFTEDANHQPLSLTVNGLQISYSYNANKRLTQLTRTQAGQTEQRSFHYEDSRNPNWLTGITDERGVRYATWTYDDKGRAISSEHAGGVEHADVTYNADGSSTVTNELGKKATYRFLSIGGIKRVSAIEGEPSANCAMSNSTFTYDARGLLKTKTDNKGFVTTYDYNERGLETTRTEATGTPQARTTTTIWHATLNLPLTVTEPGSVTTYTYDTQGRQLSQTRTAL
jgi:YD repeat-containing protein